MNAFQDRPAQHRARTSFFIDDILLNKPKKSSSPSETSSSPPTSRETLLENFEKEARETTRERLLLNNNNQSLHSQNTGGQRGSPHVITNLPSILGNGHSVGAGSLGPLGNGMDFAASYAAYLPGASYLNHQSFAHPAFQAAAAAAAAAMSVPKHLDHPFLMPAAHGTYYCLKYFV